MKNLKQAGDLSGKRVLLRADFNEPLKDGKLAEFQRIEKSLPTIDFLAKQGAKIIVLSHLQDKAGNSLSLSPVFEYLKSKLSGLKFAKDFSELEKKSAILQNGGIILFENLRFSDGEKKNDPEFSRKLSSFGNIYVNEAFSVSHRKHASVVGIPRFLPSYAGFLFEREIENLSKAFSPESPSFFILGGAKFETKIPLIKKNLEIFDNVFIGGALAHSFFKEKGWEIGNSLLSSGDFDWDGILDNPKIILPIDVVVKNEKGEVTSKPSDEVLKGETIMDSGEKTMSKIRSIAGESKFILWNGPLGNFEEGFNKLTFELAQTLAESSAQTVVGGGDTLIAITSLKLEDKFGFVSTAGGAMLDFLAKGTLPGIEALG